MSRKTDRKHIFCLLFQHCFNPFETEEIKSKLDYHLDNFSEDKISELDFVLGEVNGVLNNINSLDNHIEKVSESWDLSRISKIDLTIMRLAVYEIIHNSEISAAVAINEAVELAKEFSTEDSSKFVNGILGKLSREIIQDKHAEDTAL